jgi:dynein heavy chain
MTGALQTHSRKMRVAIDTLAFRTTVMDFTETEVRAAPDNGVYIYGLFFEGARWDRKRRLLEEMEPSVLYDYMPCIWLDPVLAEKVNTANTYECPVYKTSKRAGTLSTTGHSTNFIVTLYIATDKPEAHWVRRGVALLSQLDT